MEKEELIPYQRELIEANIIQNFDPSKVLSYTLDEVDEYIVTLKNADDLEQFYDDLETPGGTDCVPDRCVECAVRRPISRNTHYHLTQEEAEKLKEDDRVINVIPRKLREQAVVRPLWTQTSSNWNKSSSVVNTHRNWGLLRCIEGQQRVGWGTDSTSSVSGIITTTSSGKNVDVVIVDGFINPNHPEMAVNEDGTGGTRVQQFNWYSLNTIVTGNPNGTYPYPGVIGVGYTFYGDDHGMHVAGTVAGNSQGWARDANVYNLYIYDDSDGAIFWSDYIRTFHLTKSVNPATGLRNPTIINNSWGYGFTPERNNVASITYRGVTYNGPFTNNQLNAFGVIGYFTYTDPETNVSTDYISIEGWFDDIIADMQDAMNDGVIYVGAAGNSSYKIDVIGGSDYNNSLNLSTQYYGYSSLYYHRGSPNTSGANAICVGAIGANSNDYKVDFSNTGPRVTVYSPGTHIISSVHAGVANDFRNPSYKIDKYSGTSMACPQVSGVLACALEQYPRMSHAEAVEYIQGVAKTNQIRLYPYTGICTETNRISGTESFSVSPYKSYRITTSSVEDEFGIIINSGTVTSITNTLSGGVGIASTVPTNGSNDDGFWTLTCPFNVSYIGVSTNIINVGTNSYITFGTGIGSSVYQNISFSSPAVKKIMITSGDRSCQRIWYGSSGVSPNRTYRIRWEGHYTYSSPPPVGSPTIEYELVFYENTPNQIDIHFGLNSVYYNDLLNLQDSGNRYLFYRKDRPTQGTILPRVGEKVRKTSGQTWPRMGTLRYKQS